MGSDWVKVSLSDLYDVSSGLSKPASEFGSGFPFLAFTDVFNNYFVPKQLSGLVQSNEKEQEKCSVQRGDVFLTRTSETMHELGMSSVALKDYKNATFNGFTKRLRPKEDDKLVPEYVGYYLRSQIFRNEMLAFSTMSTRASLNNSMIAQIRILVPSINTQRSIAWILKKLDDKIELNRQMNETLESMAQALFKSWFVDFDPVIDNALAMGNVIPDVFAERAEQRNPSPPAPLPEVEGSKNNPPLPSGEGLGVRELFPSEFEYTEEMGWIPKGWGIGTLDEEFNVTMGQSPPGSTYNDEGKGVLFFQGSTDFGFRFPSPRIFCTEPKRMASKHDILVSVRAPVGDINMALDECSIGRGLSAVRHKTGSYSFTFYSMLQLKERFQVFEGEGTVFGSINQKDFKALPQMKIDKDLVNDFDVIIKPTDKKIELNSLEILNLTKLRDTLLPKLLSGELRIPDAEKLIAEAI